MWYGASLPIYAVREGVIVVNQLLENVVHPRPDRSQVFERRQALCFARLFTSLFGVLLAIEVSG